MTGRAPIGDERTAVVGGGVSAMEEFIFSSTRFAERGASVIDRRDVATCVKGDARAGLLPPEESNSSGTYRGSTSWAETMSKVGCSGARQLPATSMVTLVSSIAVGHGACLRTAGRPRVICDDEGDVKVAHLSTRTNAVVGVFAVATWLTTSTVRLIHGGTQRLRRRA